MSGDGGGNGAGTDSECGGAGYDSDVGVTVCSDLDVTSREAWGDDDDSAIWAGYCTECDGE